MGRVSALFNEISGTKPGWNLIVDGARDIVSRTVESGISTCDIRVEEHNATVFRYTVAVKRGSNVSLAQRPHPGKTAEDLSQCLDAALALGERSLVD